LPTVLRRIPGIEVMQMTGADFNVGVRGDSQLFANKLLVLVDGRSIYVDVQGTVFWKAIPVTLPEIKRIEVLKGPASAVYAVYPVGATFTKLAPFGVPAVDTRVGGYNLLKHARRLSFLAA
jgi:outer membrane receptor for Fe3+-dicitrate